MFNFKAVDTHRGPIPPGLRDSDVWKSAPIKDITQILLDNCVIDKYLFLPRHYLDRMFLWGRPKPGRAVQIFNLLIAEESGNYKTFEESCIFLNLESRLLISPSTIPPETFKSLRDKFCKTFTGKLALCGPQTDELIVYSHLGLGDQIVSVGLVNYLSKSFKKIYVPTKTQYYSMMKYCYSKNPNVEVFEVCKNNEYSGCPGSTAGIIDLEKKVGLQSFHLGHSRLSFPWNKSFYQNNNFDYKLSFDYFDLPDPGEEDEKMFNHLLSLNNISGDYALVSSEYSRGNFDLKIDSKYPLLYIKKSEDLYRNIFFYRKLICEAKELHLVNSAYFHLVERLPIKGQIYFHYDRGRDFAFYKPDKIIEVKKTA